MPRARLPALAVLAVTLGLPVVQAVIQRAGPGSSAVAAQPSLPAAIQMVLPVRRDTVVSAARGERDANLGGARRLKTKGIVELTLFDIVVEPLRGAVVAAPVLHLKSESDDPQRRVTVSSVAADWIEGRSRGYRAEAGSASFEWAAQGLTRWAYPESDVTAVINGRGHSAWAFAEATPPDALGWQRIAIDPRVLALRVAGLSGGFSLTDDVGSEYQRVGDELRYDIFPNRFFASRESGPESAPYVTVELAGADSEPPGSVQLIPADAVSGAAVGPGEAIVRLRTPADKGRAGTLGFHVKWAPEGQFSWNTSEPVPRYLIPLAGEPGELVTLELRDLGLAPGTTIQVGARAVDAAGNLGPVSFASLQLAGEREPVPLASLPSRSVVPAAGASPRLGVAEVSVLDPLDKVHPVTGETIPRRSASYLRDNHLWSAAERKISLYAAGNEFVAFQVLIESRDEVSAALRFVDTPDCRPTVELLRLVPIPSEDGWLPDPLVPLASAVSSIPAPEVRYRSLLADVYVPRSCPPGRLRGSLALAAGSGALELDVEVRVWNFTLPDRLSFVPQMNSYGLPKPPADRPYYRLAHRHRTCLNMVPYSWRGEVFRGYTPPAGADPDWSAWDRRFGPLLDGSAFEDLPRAGVPVEAFYLPLNENWPAPVDDHFAGGYWIDEALSDAYRRLFISGVEEFARHFQQRGWNETFFEFYLNNKLYHRQQGWDRSSAYWVFDEPINTQDFWALRWYGEAFQEGVVRALGARRAGGPKLAFRADISRPEWQRDLLDGVLDVNVVGLGFPRYLRAVMERKERNGEVVLNYGTSNRVERSNVQPAAWALWAWSVGADGILPWQTIGKEGSWKKASPLALFYPGLDGEPGPHPSLRLKAYRRGQQDVEYLTILGAVTGQQRQAVGEMALDRLGLRAALFQEGSQDAGRLEFAETDARDLWEMRVRVGATLDRLGPPDRDRWIELRTPPRDPAEIDRPAILRLADNPGPD